ncbi:MAG: 5-(carboxyamino)imidazole ribonucleotide synthase [Pseudomonadota bacterium]
MSDAAPDRGHGRLPPGSTIAILGGGQLGRMLAGAAARLGFRCHVYSDAAEAPATEVATLSVRGAYDDLAALDRFAAHADVLTYEFENVPVAAAEHLAKSLPLRPGVKPLAVAQDRLTEKTFLESIGLPVAPFAAIDSAADLKAALSAFTSAAILKTRRLGYDGKGQINVQPSSDAAAAFATIEELPAVLEQRIAFDCEISVIAVRGLDGEVRTYDCPRNTHAGGILRVSQVPSRVDQAVTDAAKRMAGRVAEALDYVGVLAVEFFVLPVAGGRAADARLIINEIAPRVHNSGHWTMDGCLVCQFENHIRAIAGWPLGPTERRADVEMVNLIGDDFHAWPKWAATADAAVHLYGKRDARPGRKMGHVNRLGAGKPRGTGPDS